MYTGHFAVALCGAGVARRVPIALLIGAAFASDIFEGTLAVFSMRDPTRVWSHSLPAAAALGLVIAIAWRLCGGSVRDCAILCVVATSHTLLDYVTATKTVWPGIRPVGLNLYGHPYADALVEGVCCVIGWWVWRRAVPRERSRSAAVWATLAVLLLAQSAATVRLLVVGGQVDLDALSKFVR